MQVSPRETHSLRAMLELALAADGRAVPLKELALRTGIPRTYLEDIMTWLHVAGLIRGSRGIYGGYVLSRSPSEVRVSDILVAAGGQPHFNPCEASDGAPCGTYLCSDTESCGVFRFWAGLQAAIESTLDGTTLEHLATQERLRRSLEELVDPPA